MRPNADREYAMKFYELNMIPKRNLSGSHLSIWTAMRKTHFQLMVHQNGPLVDAGSI